MLAEHDILDLGPLRSAFDLAPIGIAMMCPAGDGRDFRYGYVNPTMQALAPDTPMLGRTYGELHPTTSAEDLARLREVFEGAPPWIQPEAGWTLTGSVTKGRCFRIESSRIEMDSRACIFHAATEVTAEVETRHALERRAQSEREATALLLRAAGLLTESGDLRRLLKGLMAVMVDATGRHRVMVSLFDEDRGELVMKAAEGTSTLPLGVHIPFRALAPPVRRSLAERRSAVVDYESDDVPEEFRRRDQGVRLALSVPLVLGDTLIGHVLIDEPGGREPFTAREVEIVEAIAAPAAAAVENTRLFVAERLRADRLGRLKRLTDIATSSLAPREVADRSLRYFSEELGVDVTTLWSFDRESERLYPLTGVGFPPEFYERFSRGVGLADPYEVSTAYREGRPVVRCNECISEVPEPVRAAYATYGVPLGALLVLPVGGGTASRIGAVTLAWTDSHELDEDEVAFFTSAVSTLAIATENARLYEAQRRQAEYAEALNRINDALHTTLDFDEIMRRVVVELTRALEVDASAVHMRERGHWDFRYSDGLPEGLRSARLDDDQARISMLATQTRHTVVVNDVPNDPRANRELMERFAVRAFLAVPLILRDEVVGVLVAGYIGRAHGFADEQVDFAEKVASALSLALENARLYQSEHRIAETLQEALISLPDTIGGLSFAHTYRSAAEAARVGGDFYDMFELADGSVGIMIGDVAGKGLDAAVLTSLVKNAIRAHTLEPGKSPSRVLELTNELVVRSTPIEAFVTVFLGVLDCETGCLTYSNAGHTTGVIVREQADLIMLPAESPLLGAFPDVRFSEATVPLEVADTVFLYTDGLIEARSGQEQYGEERLFEVLRNAEDGPPQKLVDAALDDVREFTGDRLTDDLAILAVKRLRG